VKTTCYFCNKKAIYNLKSADGTPTLDGPQVSKLMREIERLIDFILLVYMWMAFYSIYSPPPSFLQSVIIITHDIVV
jgi:hypothetical protein